MNTEYRYQETDGNEIFFERLKFESDIYEMESKRLKEIYEKSKVAFKLKPTETFREKELNAFIKYQESFSRATNAFIRYNEAFIRCMRSYRLGFLGSSLTVVFKKSN